MSTDHTASVTFCLAHDVDMASIQKKAREIDVEAGTVGEVPEGAQEIEQFLNGYTLAQCFQIIWHNEPEWLHANVLFGWVLDEFDGERVWP